MKENNSLLNLVLIAYVNLILIQGEDDINIR